MSIIILQIILNTYQLIAINYTLGRIFFFLKVEKDVILANLLSRGMFHVITPLFETVCFV